MMKRLFVVLAVLGLSVALAVPAFCGEPEESEPGYGYGMGPGQMMGYGGGRHMMMGPGHQGRGMRGPGCGMYGSCCAGGPSARGWKSMKPEDREKWEKMRTEYQKDTLEFRKQCVTKHMELETLWAQSDVDPKKIEKLSNEVAQLQAELGKKHDEYLLRCRKEFGDKGWACPGGMW